MLFRRTNLLLGNKMEIVDHTEDEYGIIFSTEELKYIHALIGGCNDVRAKKAGFNINNDALYKCLCSLLGNSHCLKFIVDTH